MPPDTNAGTSDAMASHIPNIVADAVRVRGCHMRIRHSSREGSSGSAEPRTAKSGRHRRTVGRCVAMSFLVLTLSSCNWLVYHGDLTGSGMDSSGSSYTPAHQAWVSASLGGKLYGEPLVVGTNVFVATESDAVVALSAATGAVSGPPPSGRRYRPAIFP